MLIQARRVLFVAILSYAATGLVFIAATLPGFWRQSYLIMLLWPFAFWLIWKMRYGNQS